MNNIQSLREASRNMKRVYHCAALATDWGTWERFHSTNVNGIRNLLKIASETSVKSLYISALPIFEGTRVIMQAKRLPTG